MDTKGNYEYLLKLVSAARADGLDQLAAEYEQMAGTYERQIAAEKRIEEAAEKDANSQAWRSDYINAKYNVETSSLLSRNERHNAAMARSNLYLAIRNAVYFE